jgi:hypothetical protein
MKGSTTIGLALKGPGYERLGDEKPGILNEQANLSSIGGAMLFSPRAHRMNLLIQHTGPTGVV